METTNLVNPLKKEDLQKFSNNLLTAEQLSEVKGGSCFGLAVCCIGSAAKAASAE